MEVSFFKCLRCGKVIAVLKGSPCSTMCCGDAMVELKAGTTDAAVEKHVPVVTVDGSLVSVSVGAVAHPMLEEHFIEWIALVSSEGISIKALKPGAEPKVSFALVPGETVIKAYAFCNLHGLWASN